MSQATSNWNQSSKKVLLWGFVFSILVHVSFLLKRFHQDIAISPEESKERLVEIEKAPPEAFQEIPAPKSAKIRKDAQIAETEDAKNRQIDPNAAFLGEHNQKAESQSRANRIDDFRQRKGTGKQGTASADEAIPPTGENGVENPDTTVDTDGAELAQKAGPKPGVKRDWKTLSLKDLSLGGDGGEAAATDDYLPHVNQGDKTLLSTREFRYYSYYHRIKELLRQHWKPFIEQQVTRIWRKGRNLSSDELTTRVLVLLDKTGQIQRISKIGSCGVNEIDEAAVQAFHRAAPFPNPPAGLVEADGFVRINWDFILKTENTPRIQFRTAGGGGNAGPQY